MLILNYLLSFIERRKSKMGIIEKGILELELLKIKEEMEGMMKNDK